MRLRRELNLSRPTERLREPRQHHEVGVKLNTLKPTDAERGEAVLVLEFTEAPLDSTATPVQLADERDDDDDDRDQDRDPGEPHDVEGPLLAGPWAGLRRVGIERRRRLARDLILALDDACIRLDDMVSLVVAHRGIDTRLRSLL